MQAAVSVSAVTSVQLCSVFGASSNSSGAL